jgi:L-alanine-DL-glutamate epimerase-like enolase superfamily enzyme
MSESRVGIAAAAALVAALDNIRYADLDSYHMFEEPSGITGGFEQAGSTIRLTDRPGLGVEVALDFG